MKNNKVLKDFELFKNPDDNDITNDYDFISIKCLEECSYIHYIAIPVINGEINGKPKEIKLSDLYNEEYYIIAYNHLDNIALEVIWQ